MLGPRIPTGERIINDPAYPPVNPADYAEANADHYMNLWLNLSAGTFINDDAILLRHLALLRAREQTVPNMTLYVSPGYANIMGVGLVSWAGGNTPLFTAPVTNPRRDRLVLNAAGALQIVVGVEAASPALPAEPQDTISLHDIYMRVGMTRIRDNDTQEAGQGYINADLRPWLTSDPTLGVASVSYKTLSVWDMGAL